jgi:hypothetical protein
MHLANGMGRGLSHSDLFNMQIFLQAGLALAGAIALHAALFLASTGPMEIGKNTPVLAHPVRARILSAGTFQLSQTVNAVRAAPVPLRIAPASPPPSAAEGSTERSEKIYADISNKYFRPDELDTRPGIVTDLDLGAANMSPTQEGDAIVRFFINENGSVDRMEIEDSTLPQAMITELYVQRERLYFTPGIKSGLDVKSVIAYRIHLAREPVTILTGSGAPDDL